MIYTMHFIMVRGTEIIHSWECTNGFYNKEEAMKFAQNVIKGFNGSNIVIYYRICTR